MKKVRMILAFLGTGIPAWCWALPAHTWRTLIAPYLPDFAGVLLRQTSRQSYEQYVWIFSGVWVGVFIIDLWYSQTIGVGHLGRDPRTGYECVDKGVPHSHFKFTQNGFKVLIRNTDGADNGDTLLTITGFVGGLWFLNAGLVPGPALLLAVGSAISYVVGARTPTCIVVTTRAIRIRDHVTNTLLDRQYFVTFKADDEWLGYEYGARKFNFGGRMRATEVMEIAASLNRLLAAMPITVGHGPSYDLRPGRSEF